MSGICGWVRWDGGPVTRRHLSPMMRAAQHRGPDGRGEWYGRGVGLGHLALHTTPESVHESQPLVDPEGEVALVADARIDNRADLMGRLGIDERGGERPVSDAALILAAYLRWGAECPARLIGDFAFAVWDGRTRSILAARDPFGMRALYFRAEGGGLLFATELKQLLAAPGVSSGIDEVSVGAYLAGAFPAPGRTFDRGISLLPHATALRANADGLRTRRFWELSPDRKIRYGSDPEYAEHFLELFQEAVRARLRSVAPVGLLLSGGLDSGAIGGVVGRLLESDSAVRVPGLRAYSFAFEELAQCDERHVSEALAEHFGFPVTDVPADDAWPLREQVGDRTDRDGPLLLSHYVLMARALSMAREEGIGLVLSGDRGDLMAGLGIYDLPTLLRSGRLRELLGDLRALAARSGRTVRGQARRELLRWARDSTLAEMSRDGRLPPLRALAERTHDVPRWVRPEFAEASGAVGLGAMGDAPRTLPGHATRERYRAVFTPLQLHGVLASERTHARFGQAFADPWSDRRLAEFAVAVPQRVLNTVGDEKRLTRLAMRGIVPEQFLSRATKTVPTPLFDRGLRERGSGTVLALLTGSESERRGYIDERRAREHYRNEIQGRGASAATMWRALTLEMWLREHWRGG